MVSLCLSSISLQASILTLASWICGSISSKAFCFFSISTRVSSRDAEVSCFRFLSLSSDSMRSKAIPMFWISSLFLSRCIRNPPRLSAARAFSCALISASCFPKDSCASFKVSCALSNTGFSSSVRALFSLAISVWLTEIFFRPSAIVFI